jgi:hypothetical protein
MKTSVRMAKKTDSAINSINHNQELQYMSQYMALLLARQKSAALNPAS